MTEKRNPNIALKTVAKPQVKKTKKKQRTLKTTRGQLTNGNKYIPINNHLKCKWTFKFKWNKRSSSKTYIFFHGGSASKESTCNAGDPGSVPGSGRSHGEGDGYPF